jgi:site-specific DNA-methyltransferase (adenine-specific)
MNKIGQAELHNIDCMAYMATLPDKAFDLAIVDPPYGINILHSGGLGTNCDNKKHNRKYHERKNWDKEKPSKKYFQELIRVSKNQIIWGANYFVNHLTSSMGWVFWDKGQNLSMSDGELAYTSFNKALRRIVINRGQLMVEGGTIHPTQKPIKLYEWLLTNYAEKGNKILDTHLGSGSIAIACNNLGFNLVGCELDEDYYNSACDRINQATAQVRLFD